jgi:hypothetical protein
MPRRSKLTPAVQQRICDAIGIGATYEHAAAYGGIHYDTLRQWCATKPAFSEALKAAEARAVVGWLAKIEQAASAGTWQAAAWKLERRYPQLYGRTVQEQQHTGTVTQHHTGAVEVRAIDYRHSIRALRPPEADDTDGADDGEGAA